jgi:hypothetical protein
MDSLWTAICILIVTLFAIIPQTGFSFRGSGGQVEVTEIRCGVLRRSRLFAVFTFVINVRPSPTLGCAGVGKPVLPCMRGIHFHHKCAPPPYQITTLGVRRGAAVLRCVRGVYFHHTCAPLSHQLATLVVWWGVAVLLCVRGAHFQLLGCLGLFLAASGCLWLLLAAPGCSWLLLAASGCSWLPLAASGCC